MLVLHDVLGCGVPAYGLPLSGAGEVGDRLPVLGVADDLVHVPLARGG